MARPSYGSGDHLKWRFHQNSVPKQHFHAKYTDTQIKCFFSLQNLTLAKKSLVTTKSQIVLQQTYFPSSTLYQMMQTTSNEKLLGELVFKNPSVSSYKSSKSLPSRVYFYICCVINNFFQCFEPLFLFLTQFGGSAYNYISQNFDIICNTAPLRLKVCLQGSPHVRFRGFQNPANFCLWNPESWKFSSRKSGIQPMIGIWNPSSTDKESKIQYLESGIHGVESRIQDCLGFLYMG